MVVPAGWFSAMVLLSRVISVGASLALVTEMVKGTFPQLDGSELELETDGLLARIIQHETDHLNGVLFIDRVSAATKLMLRRELKRLKG